MTLRLVATGTGRSGTKYASTVIGRAGLNSGHEVTFDHEGYHPERNMEADSSCYAAYHLEEIPDVPVALIYRHPVDQMESAFAHYPDGWPRNWVGDGDNPHVVHHPEIADMSTFDALCHMYVHHHELILDAKPRWVFNLNNIDWVAILGELGIATDVATAAFVGVPATLNRARRPRTSLPRPVPADVMDMYRLLEGMAP